MLVPFGALAAQSEPGASGVRFYPHLSGAGSPHWRADVWGGFLGLSLASSSADIVRSVMEGITFQIQENLDVMADIGIAVRELILFGGGSQSQLWAQMISDIAGLTVTVTEMTDVANWGACILAGTAGKLLEGDPLSQSGRSGPAAQYHPVVAQQTAYGEVYRDYCAQETKLLS